MTAKKSASLPIGRTITDADAQAIAERVAALIRPLQPKGAIEAGALYTVSQAADLAGVHMETLRAKLRVGSVWGSRRLGRWRIKGSELLKLAS